MKYIVLSFDDGLHNFIDNALPILDKYNAKATINIVSGFSDGSNNDVYERINNKEIRYLYDNGHEIANHSNSHLKKENNEDFRVGKLKISEIIGDHCLGAVMPYNQKPTKELKKYFENNNYPYVALGCYQPLKKDLTFFRLRLIRKLFKKNNKRLNYTVRNYLYLNSINCPSSCVYVNRVGAFYDVSADDIMHLIKHMKKNTYISIMFHSIIKAENEEHPYMEGTWYIDEFQKLITSICSNPSKYKIITQMQAVNLKIGNKV